MKPPGSDRKTYGKTTHTYFLANPNLEDEINLKGGMFVTSQFSIRMLYIGHHMHIIFYLHFGCDPRDLKQLKDPRRELEISQIFIFEFFQIWKEDQFDFNIFSLQLFPIINKREKINDFFNKRGILEKKF